MGQLRLRRKNGGKNIPAFLQSITPSYFETQKIGTAKYSVLLTDHNTIVDDIIVTKFADDDFFIVINAGTKDKDIEFLRARLPHDIDMEISENDLIALQGSGAARALEKVMGQSFDDLYFMQAREVGDMIISRLGYTGEDGFEVSVPRAQTLKLWESLIAIDTVKPIGLAARDTLRLEMGFSLYGHDIDEDHTPLESDLGFVCSPKNNRAGKIASPTIKRVGIKLDDKGIAREGADIYAGTTKIGALSSGGYSPVLKCGIGMGYVPLDHINATDISIKVRDNFIPASIVSLPFIPSRVRRPNQ
jgi:aminomethyltransferase